jgi:hypothetical protein
MTFLLVWKSTGLRRGLHNAQKRACISMCLGSTTSHRLRFSRPPLISTPLLPASRACTTARSASRVSLLSSALWIRRAHLSRSPMPPLLSVRPSLSTVALGNAH